MWQCCHLTVLLCMEVIIYQILKSKRFNNTKWCTQRPHGFRNMWTYMCKICAHHSEIFFFTTSQSSRSHSGQISVEKSILDNQSSFENACPGEAKCFLSRELQKLENISVFILRGGHECEPKSLWGLLQFWLSLIWKRLVLRPWGLDFLFSYEAWLPSSSCMIFIYQKAVLTTV